MLNQRSPLRLAVKVKVKLTLSPLYINVAVGESSMIARLRSDSCLEKISVEDKPAEANELLVFLHGGLLNPYPVLPRGPHSSS